MVPILQTPYALFLLCIEKENVNPGVKMIDIAPIFGIMKKKETGDIMRKTQTRNTKGKIIAAAWKLFYEQGYEDTTVDEIIRAAQTSKGSFYHYFSGKDALLSTLAYLFDEKIRGAAGSDG